MASSPYHQLFRHRVKYLAQRYDSDKVDSEYDDGTLIRVFHGEPGWHSEYEEDGDPRFEQSSQLAPESVASRFFSPKMAGTLFVILSYATGR